MKRYHMKKLLLILLICLGSTWNIHADNLGPNGGRLPNQGTQVGGKGADGNFHFLSVDNTGALNVVGLGGGSGGAVTVADGADVTQGANADAAVAAGAAGTISAKLRRISTDIGTNATNTGTIATNTGTTATNTSTIATNQTNGNLLTQVTRQIGAANYANGQVTATTTAGTLKTATATRRSIMIKNTDAAITVYIGAATVTAANGVPLKAGESIAVDTTALIQVISASGTPVVAYMETSD